MMSEKKTEVEKSEMNGTLKFCFDVPISSEVENLKYADSIPYEYNTFVNAMIE